MTTQSNTPGKQLEGTLFSDNKTSIWLYIDSEKVTLTRSVNLDAPEGEIPEIIMLDGRLRFTDLIFALEDALKAFDVDNRDELYELIIRRFSLKKSLQEMAAYLKTHKVKFDKQISDGPPYYG